jgi:hypothetical protein
VKKPINAFKRSLYTKYLKIEVQRSALYISRKQKDVTAINASKE